MPCMATNASVKFFNLLHLLQPPPLSPYSSVDTPHPSSPVIVSCFLAFFLPCCYTTHSFLLCLPWGCMGHAVCAMWLLCVPWGCMGHAVCAMGLRSGFRDLFILPLFPSQNPFTTSINPYLSHLYTQAQQSTSWDPSHIMGSQPRCGYT